MTCVVGVVDGKDLIMAGLKAATFFSGGVIPPYKVITAKHV